MKKDDKKAIIATTASGALVGSSVGSLVGQLKSNKIYKEANKKSMENSKNFDKISKELDSLVRLREDPDISKNPEISKGLDKKIKDKLKTMDDTILKHDKLAKETNKMVNKKFWKSLGIGAAIGTGLGIGAVAGVKAIKKHKNKKDMEKKYSVIMTEDELRLFSRHTPKNLEKYKDLTDEELKELSEGELDYYIDSEADKAGRNTQRYINKKLPKYLAIGAGGGAAAGALLSSGSRVGGGLYGALIGGMAGGIGAAYRGSKKASQEGHSRENRTRKISSKADRVRGGNSYSRMKEREDRLRQQQLDAQRNQAILAAALR